MIICRFYGGLGNQMFQYATSRALAVRHQTCLVADSRPFRRYKLHGYLIDRFQTELQDSTEADLQGLVLPPEKRGVISSTVWACRNRGRLTYFSEKSLAFDPAFHKLPDNTYLRGYWQSEKYFSEIADQLRTELTRPEPVNDQNLDRVRQMADCCSVSLHIRRGDYVSNAKTQKVHGTCSLEYYRNAAQLLADRTGSDPTFFVFSDDPEWTRENLNIPFQANFVTDNPVDDPWLDLHLMKSCHHHIIANSSFSWWGAWLNANPDKIVVAPQRWFADPGMNDQDIVPETWTRLASA